MASCFRVFVVNLKCLRNQLKEELVYLKKINLKAALVVLATGLSSIFGQLELPRTAFASNKPVMLDYFPVRAAKDLALFHWNKIIT